MFFRNVAKWHCWTHLMTIHSKQDAAAFVLSSLCENQQWSPGGGVCFTPLCCCTVSSESPSSLLYSPILSHTLPYSPVLLSAPRSLLYCTLLYSGVLYLPLLDIGVCYTPTYSGVKEEWCYTPRSLCYTVSYSGAYNNTKYMIYCLLRLRLSALDLLWTAECSLHYLLLSDCCIVIVIPNIYATYCYDRGLYTECFTCDSMFCALC